MVFEWVGEGKSLPIQNMSRVGSEFEWVAGGEFEVVKSEVKSAIAGDRVVVTVKKIDELPFPDFSRS